jgi:hypothetical protein
MHFIEKQNITQIRSNRLMKNMWLYILLFVLYKSKIR